MELKQEYTVSSVTRICTIIALLLDGLSFLTLTVFVFYFRSLFELITRLIKIDPDITSRDILIFNEYYGLIHGFFVLVTILTGIFFIINLILFTKLINSKVSKKAAKNITIYQIIYGALAIPGNTISAILYLISGINCNSDLRPAITNPVIDDY